LCAVEDDLHLLDFLLRRHPNLFTDTGPWHRVGAIAARHSESFRTFYVRWSDRIMFAGDLVASSPFGDGIRLEGRLRRERLLLARRRIRLAGGSTLDGLDLPAATLRDLYQLTAERVFLHR